MPQTRISRHAHQTLRRISSETGHTSEQLLDEAVELLDRRRLLEEINAGYAALRAHPLGWADEEAERGVWDATLRDGE